MVYSLFMWKWVTEVLLLFVLHHLRKPRQVWQLSLSYAFSCVSMNDTIYLLSFLKKHLLWQSIVTKMLSKVKMSEDYTCLGFLGWRNTNRISSISVASQKEDKTSKTFVMVESIFMWKWVKEVLLQFVLHHLRKPRQVWKVWLSLTF